MSTKKETATAEMTTEQLEQLLNDRKQQEREAAAAARAEYEAIRNKNINTLAIHAVNLSKALAEFKASSAYALESFKNMMLEYGDIRKGKDNKGSFEIKNEQFKIVVASQVKKSFDERSILAEEKLKEFLLIFVKKKNRSIYNLVMALLERNSITGDFDITNINRLYKMENDFDDPNWVEAIKLFKESFNATGTTIYVRFYERNANNGWGLINLNFSNA
jgi:hypothetical protein